MQHLTALGVVPGDPDSAAKAFADLKTELGKEKIVRQIAQIEVETLTRAIGGLKFLPADFLLKFQSSKKSSRVWIAKSWMG
jgi:hypothetical protein